MIPTYRHPACESAACECIRCRLQPPDYYLDVAQSIMSFLDHWSWAMAESDQGGNIDQDAFRGLGRVTRYLSELLNDCGHALAAERQQYRGKT